MKKTLAIVVMCCAFGGVSALEIKAYDTQLDVAPDGSAKASTTVQLAGCQAGNFKLPTGFAGIENLQLQDGPTGVALKLAASKEQSTVDIELPDNVPGDAKITFEFQVPGVLYEPKPEEGQKSAFPAGARLLRHAFVNTQAASVSKYSMQVRLPKETLVHAIREQLPKAKRKEFTPRVELDRFNGQQGALLQISGLKQGDRTSMELEVIDESRSYGWLLVGLALMAGYLVSFRDLVKSAVH
jgi:hypothetical protein